MTKVPHKPDYRTAEVIDRRAVAKFFEAQGFQVTEIDQLWRHLHAHLERAGQSFFLKMASTPDIGIRLNNEITWNKQLTSQLDTASPFRVPRILENGVYRKLPYYVSSYHAGSKLADFQHADPIRLARWLPSIMKANQVLLTMGAQFDLPKDVELTGSLKELIAHYLKKIRGWHEDLPPEHQIILQPVLDEIIEHYPSVYHPGLNHGDFVPWHMLEEGNQFVLIDAEHAATKTPRFYDIAYFYHRVYTKAHLPALAARYLELIQDNLPLADQAVFRPAFRSALAGRIIGGFLDAKFDGSDDKHHRALLHEYLKSSSLRA